MLINLINKLLEKKLEREKEKYIKLKWEQAMLKQQLKQAKLKAGEKHD